MGVAISIIPSCGVCVRAYCATSNCGVSFLCVTAKTLGRGEKSSNQTVNDCTANVTQCGMNCDCSISLTVTRSVTQCGMKCDSSIKSDCGMKCNSVWYKV